MRILDKLRAQVISQPGNADAWSSLGHALLSQGAGAEADAAFKRSMALRADNGAALMGMARMAMTRRNDTEAIALLTQVLHLTGETSALRVHAAHRLCDLLIKNCRAGEARDVLRDVVDIADAIPPVWFEDMCWRAGAFWWEPVVGHRLTLRRPSAEDAAWLKRSFMDDTFASTVNRNYAAKVRGMSVEQIAAQLGMQLGQSPVDLGAQMFLIDRKNAGPIGIASFVSMDLVSRRAEFIIGFVDEVPHGVVVLEASALLAEFAFRRACLHKVSVAFYGDNPRIRLLESVLERVGFIREGVQREHMRVSRERYIDVHLWGGLARDILSNALLNKLSTRLERSGTDEMAVMKERG
ncbi:MAG TPA: GNAT family N-acetyltransferase [Aquabacterium sp.]|uniref:GNAT family N-acetyltransferase n=1 Tax=Aquabacterium sp. TaxID=1872578 RepID=UPI002E30C01E|nr:GNAT family N-acetyltransferase [Aquabacterium sp.]HEX5355794.1 GNAT family N-acetyltransferase [Aquabacterium sp.]